MSVYTAVSPAELEAWLTRYAVGTLVEQAPIASGIENTNYFVTTTRGRFVLTLFERLPADELPFYLNLMAHLARAGVACPAPAPDRTGALFSMLNGKPAGLTQRVDGAPIVTPDAPHCAAVGDALARMHLASVSYRSRLGNRRGPAWWRQAARAVRPFLTAPQNELLAAELKHQTGFGRTAMAKGAIHGDLFCDNVLFAGDRVAGLIDFGFAATDFYAYDLAITVNDWCVVKECDARGTLEPTLVAALLAGYQSVRPLDAVEREQWPSLLRAAALRFWLSRLYDLHLPRPGELVHAHDPAHFERILRDRIAHPARIAAVPGAAR
jgi:homoserine kinase type II